MSTDMNSNIMYLLSFHEEWKIDDSALNKTLNALQPTSTQTVEFRCSIYCIKNLSKKNTHTEAKVYRIAEKKSVIDELKQVLKEKKNTLFQS